MDRGSINTSIVGVDDTGKLPKASSCDPHFKHTIKQGGNDTLLIKSKSKMQRNHGGYETSSQNRFR